MPHSILTVDDSALVRSLIRSTVEASGSWRVCGEAENVKVAVEKAKGLHPDDAQAAGIKDVLSKSDGVADHLVASLRNVVPN